MAAPLWLAWISFDYLFAGELFYDFIPFRIAGSISSLLVLYLVKKELLPFMLLQSFMFLYFNTAIFYMLVNVDKEVIDVYFQGYSMVLMFMFFILILRPIELFAYALMAVFTFIGVLLLSSVDAVYILGNGGFVFLTVLIVMLIIGVLRYRGVLRDAVLTERIREAKEIEKLNVSLETSIKEKETLLQEIHHRVKNNLQIISSILSLQRSYVKDQGTKDILRESINRIRSMSVIHETLYKSKDFAFINFSDYLLGLSKEIIATYKSDPQLTLTVVKDLSDLNFNIRQAIPCGLIVNEIITNAVKYAFHSRSEGEIYLSINKDSENVYLEIGDNGSGLPTDFVIEEADSLGLQLVQTLVEQLVGTLTIDHSNGTLFKIVFPLDSKLEGDKR
jgi:two-component sensor histidine kinase